MVLTSVFRFPACASFLLAALLISSPAFSQDKPSQDKQVPEKSVIVPNADSDKTAADKIAEDKAATDKVANEPMHDIEKTAADKPKNAPLVDVLQLPFVTNGVTTSTDGRIFMTMVHLDGSDGPQIVEWKNGEAVPYPTSEWNERSSKVGSNFIRPNALRVGPDGNLWIVDTGSPFFGENRVSHGARLIEINLQTNTVGRLYDLDKMTSKKSMLDDVRFNGQTAYLSDAGDPGLIVLDLQTGSGFRVLGGTPSVTAGQPMSAEGKPLVDAKGKPVMINADQLEVSPDGQWLFYQPATGPFSRIETKWLRTEVSEDDREQHVEMIAETPSTGGTAIDNSGNIYLSDTDQQRILKISATGDMSILVEDARLLWVDAMWIDNQGFLWMPAAQFNRLGLFQGGTSKITFPVHVYKMQVNSLPATNDHN